MNNQRDFVTTLPLISISIPVLNEASNLYPLYARLSALAEHMSQKCTFEFVFSDNHSDDETWNILSNLAVKDPRVKAIRFSKNEGFQRSILMNYLHTRGDAVMQIDADLQDPPEMLKEFFDLWQQGFLVVYGIREKRQESLVLTAIRRVGYWFIDKISEHPIPRDVGDFRLIDRKVIEALATIRTHHPYLRGMIAELGFKQTGLKYGREARTAGESKFNLTRLIRLGLIAVFNHSVLPLRFASFLGGVILVVSFLGAIAYVIMRIYHPDWPRGFASMYIFILFGIGINAFLLGMIGEYLLRIYLILRNDPIAIIEKSLNFSGNKIKLQEKTQQMNIQGELL